MMFLIKMTQVRLILIVAAFLTLTGNFTFLEKTILVYPLSENWLFVGSLLVWLFVFLSALLLLLCYRHTIKPILIILLMISSIVSYSTNNFGIVFDHNMIANTFETNTTELLDLVSFKSFIYLLFFGLLPSYFVWTTTITKAPLKTQLWQRIKAFVIMMFIFVLLTMSFYKPLSSFARENPDLKMYIIPTYYLYSMTKYVGTKFNTSTTPFSQIGLDAKINKKENKQRLLVLVLGETARVDRFSLNGYKRQTNPMLEKEEVVSFQNMTSCGTDTSLSVPCMFSSLDRSNYSHSKGKNMSNVLDIVSHSGVEVLWLDNNSDSKGVADRVTFKDYRLTGVNPICDIECRDEGMLAGLQDFIDTNLDKDMLVVLHTMGSHGPAYYKRYPDSFEVFLPACQTNQLNECNDEEINNAYDNTIVYTDYVLSKLIAVLENNTKVDESAMFYVSDHGESLGENGLYLHGMPYLIAPDEQKKVAALMWFNEGLSQSLDIDAIKEKIEVPLSHDNLFHTLLGFMNIETEVYQQDMDIIAQ
jgi:lipid A ethanolaminephosphotransferase